MDVQQYAWRKDGARISRRRLLAAAGAGAAGLAALTVFGACGDEGEEPAATATAAGDAELAFLTLENAAARIKAKQVSPVEVTEAMLARIERLQPQLNAFITVTGEQALAQARAAEAEIAAGTYRGKLHGIPIAHKDVFDTKGVLTTYGSKIYAERVPDEDAAVVAKLADAGAVMVGKLNMFEFATALAGVNPHYGVVPNPWNLQMYPGGTSSGSGVAVAAGLVYAATGSDTGGSIRNPASFCGVVGLKPTYGRVSVQGALAASPTLDHAGPLARAVRDTAIVLQALAGYDPRDATTADVPVPDYLAGVEQGPKGLRIGVPTDYFWTDAAPEVEEKVRTAIADLERAGATVSEVPFPQAEDYYTAMTTVGAIEVAQTHAATYPSRKADYGADVVALLEYVLQSPVSERQKSLQDARDVVARARTGEADALLDGLDVLAMPTNRQPPFSNKEAQEKIARPDIAEMASTMRAENVAVFNATGQPAITVPCGLTADGMPVGLMLVARRWDEATLLRAARAYELVRGPFPAPPV